MNNITFSCGGQQVLVHLKESLRAKRLSLRLSPQNKGFVLTIPPGTSRDKTQHFLKQCLPWIEKNKEKLKKRISIEVGGTVDLYGEKFQCIQDPLRQKPVICRESQSLRLPLRYSQKKLHDCLRQWAEKCLSPYTIEAANKLGQSLEKVKFRDMQSRWGSCSSRKTISLNWRLILLPREVAEYVCIHEVSHLLHMNHSFAFWKVVEHLCPSYQTHKKWLKAHGYGVMAV